jgi:hypothetical protein
MDKNIFSLNSKWNVRQRRWRKCSQDFMGMKVGDGCFEFTWSCSARLTFFP